MTLAYWHWLVLGMILMGLEIFVPTFTILWFGIGAVAVGLVLLAVPGLGLALQILLWVVLSALCTFVWFRYLKRMAPDRTKAGLSIEAIIGETGMVITVPAEHRRGTLRFSRPLLGAEEWQFMCDQAVAVGDRVVVQNVSGNTLVVGRA